MDQFADIQLDTDLTVIGSGHFFRVGEEQFGVPGLIAIESVGPYASVQRMGPFLMVHDGFFQPGFGIGHHPHRTNERLFYILAGRVEHDDSLNHIRGTMDEGDLGRLTEGVRGMLHQEWNGLDDQVTRAFILVYHPDTHPPIPAAEFAVLRAADRVRVRDARGVVTLELVGPKSSFRLNHSGLFRYTDATLADGATLDVTPSADRGALLYPIEGAVTVQRGGRDGLELNATGSVHPEGPDNLAVAWGARRGPAIRLRAEAGPARVVRIEFQRGTDDLVFGETYLG
ncbi:MAG: pirin family protein [Candidatus Limnocylindria bacterium]